MNGAFRDIGGWTEVGSRQDNQDYLICSRRSLIVADGVGGGPAGRFAAQNSCLAVDRSLGRRRRTAPLEVRAAFDAARRALGEHAQRRPEDGLASSTLIVATANDGSRGGQFLDVHWLGDSRAVLLRRGEQELTVVGGDAPSESGSLESWISASSCHTPRFARCPAMPGDVVLLHTDGLDVLADTDVSEALAAVHDRAPADLMAREITQLAVACGATDNVTVALGVVGGRRWRRRGVFKSA